MWRNRAVVCLALLALCMCSVGAGCCVVGWLVLLFVGVVLFVWLDCCSGVYGKGYVICVFVRAWSICSGGTCCVLS